MIYDPCSLIALVKKRETPTEANFKLKNLFSVFSVEMVEIVASISIQMLHDLAREEKVSYEVIEVTDQVMQLVSVLAKIENLLKNAHNSELVLNNIETIRYFAYRIEDVLETCAVKVAVVFLKNDDRCIKRLMRRSLGVLNDGIGIRNIRAMISDIKPELNVFLDLFPDAAMASISSCSEPQVADRSVRWPKQMYPRGTIDHFVGMEKELKELISLVVEGKQLVVEGEQLVVVEKQHRVIAIWGVKGLGKTTLARKVYNHPNVRRCFKAFAWVSLSQDRQIGILLQDILRRLGPGKVKGIAEQNMIDQLKEIQRLKSCLVVLDGICEVNQWEHISRAFPMEEGMDTRILLTTREENIAGKGFPYKLRLLDEDEGWELLTKHAFPKTKAPDFGMLPKLGKEMVQKCEYLPSAISSLGRILSGKISLNEWRMVNSDVNVYLQSDYQSEADERLLDKLDSIYDLIPYHLKKCFLYLGIFRADEDINSEEVIFLWVAEGMVSSAGTAKDRAIMDTAEDRTIMDKAEDYLQELAYSGLLQVQVDELSASRRFQLFCLQNRARELSLYQGEKEDFRLKVMNFCDGKQPTSDSFDLSDGTRRFAIHFNKQANMWACELAATDHLRSLFLINSDQKCVDIPVRISDFEKFKLLRVLHFVRCKFEGRELPTGIDKLVNLRYLGLLYCDLDKLPRSISNLRNLHVLNVRAYGNAQITIPENVLSEMIRLKHLHLPHYSDREQTKKLSLDNLLELETLVGFNSLIHDLDSLPKLQKLRHLVIHAYSNDSLTSCIRFIMLHGARIRTDLFVENKCNFTSPEGLAILEELLTCPNLRALTLSMVLIYKFPDCGKLFSSDLTELKLIGCRLTEDPMEALGKFLNLQKLCLGYGAFVGREIAIHDGGFVNLEYLEFRSLPNLKEWTVDEGAMHRLSSLTIRRCPELEKIPDGLTSISSLKNFEVELAPGALQEGREAEYRQKFAFVNSFNIRELDHFSDCKNNEVE